MHSIPAAFQPALRCGAVASMLALGSAGGAFAQGAVTLNGHVDAAARWVRNDAGSKRSIVSGSNTTSRLIVRGVEDLGGGWKAGFWLEGTFFSDTGSVGNQFWDRQATVRLSGPWGEVRAGRDWVPSFLSYAGADSMGYVGVGLAGNLIAAGGTTAIRRAFGSVTPTTSRSNNALEYWLPDGLGGVYGQVMVAPSEGGNASGSFNLHGMRLGWRTGGVDTSAHLTSARIDATGERWQQAGLTGLFTTAAGWKFSAAWIDIRYMDARQNNLILGLRVPVGADELKFSYGRADQQGRAANGNPIDANDAQQLAVSYVHNLSKRSALYANLATLKNKGAATFSISGGPAGAAPGTRHDGFEVGMRHSF